MMWFCLGQKRQDYEISQEKCRSFQLGEQSRSPVRLRTAKRTWYLGGELLRWGEDESSSGTHWHWWNHLSTRGTILNPCLVGNQVHFPSTFPHAAEHNMAHKKGGGSHVNSLTMTIKCHSTPPGQQVRSFTFEGKQGNFCVHKKIL